MLRVIVLSLLALAVVFVAARAIGPTPQQIEDSILLAELNAEEGATYRQALAGQSGVVTLPGGLLVEVLHQGDGSTPREDDWVQVHYRGWHIDGREFENSWRRGEPATLPVEQAIAGWRQALLGSPEGSRLRLVLPPELAYGRTGGGAIGPEETLIFELELLGIIVPPTVPERDALQQAVPNLR